VSKLFGGLRFFEYIYRYNTNKTNMAKQCTKCGKVKDYSQFSKLTKSKDGHQFHCKECNNKENYRFRHEIDPEYMNRWFSDNKEHWNEYILLKILI
jgi:hypothetical protein